MSKLVIRNRDLCDVINCNVDSSCNVSTGEGYIQLCQMHKLQYNENLLCDIHDCNFKRFQNNEYCKKCHDRNIYLIDKVKSCTEELINSIKELKNSYGTTISTDDIVKDLKKIHSIR